MNTPSSKIDPASWKKAFESLPADYQTVLYFLAIHTAPIRNIRIQEACLALQSPPAAPMNVPAPAKKVKENTAKKPGNLSNISSVAEQLKQLGWIDISIVDGLLVCKSELRERIIHHLHTAKRYKQFAKALFAVIGGRYFMAYQYGYYGAENDHQREKKTYERPKSPEDLIRELRHLLLIYDLTHLTELLRYINQKEDGQNWFQDVWNFFQPQNGVTWLYETSVELRSRVFQWLLVRSLSQLECSLDGLWDVLIETGCDPKCEPATQVLMLDYALCTGKLDDPGWARLSGKAAPALHSAHKAFIEGRYGEAVELYQFALKAFGNLKILKNTVFPYLSGIFHILAELREGNRTAALVMTQFALKQGADARGVTAALPMHMSGTWRLIENITKRLMGQNPTQLLINTTQLITERPVWLSFLLSVYESKWFQLAPVSDVKDYMVRFLRQPKTGFPWITAETAEMCEALNIGKLLLEPPLKQAAEYRQQTKAKPLRDLFAAKKDWERWLESLQKLADETPKETKKEPADKKKTPNTRLAWRVADHYSKLVFTPYEQKCSKYGAWSEGKPTTLARLFKSMNQLGFLTEQDKNICAKIRFRGNDYSLPDEIASDFVGHPLLFTVPDSKTSKLVRMELISSRPEIAMEEKEGQLLVTFSPPLVIYENISHHGAYGQFGNPDDADRDFFTIKESPTRYKVVKLTKTEMQIRLLLGNKGRVFPKQSQVPLTTLLGKLAGEMSVKTDANVEFANIPTVPVDPKLYIYLAPNGEGIQADFFTRPLGPDTPGHRPGVGSERILGEVAGQNVQTVRSFTNEKKIRGDIIAKCPSFQNGETQSENQYIFASPGDALALLAELKDVQSDGKTGLDFELYWPHGEKYSVTSTASFGNFELSFHSAEDWLSATGTLKVDGDVFELQKLFELLNENSESRFIKLSDQKFLSLTNEFRKRLGELKMLSQVKGKTIQLHPLAAAGMEDFFDAIPTLQKNALWNSIKERIATAREYKAPFPKDFVGDLRDYQLDGYDWLARCAKWGVGCCLADDMGLGKTIQALVLLLQRANQGPALVVAPTSVCFNWEREAAKFAPTLKIKRIQPLTTATAKEERDKLIASAKKRDVLITSYTLLQQEAELFAKKKYATVILDESQAIKNPESNRAKAASALQAEFRIAMTGTPIENHLTELWSLFRFLNPGLFGSQKSFEDRFAVPIQRDRSASARNTLRRLVHPFILRRTKSQVLEELPARTEIVREIELSQEEKALYEAARLNALKELQDMRDKNSGEGRLQILAALTRLRQLCCNPKMILPNSKVESSKLEAFREIMEELKENRHRVLVFSQFVKHLEILKAELDTMGISYQYLDGSTPSKERQKRVDAFQSGESDAFLISIKAGGSGLNLTAADYVIHTDPWWNPAVEDQATDRAHRIGQTRPVTVYRLITQGTIEEKIVRLHHEKRDIADKLLEGTDQATKLSAEELIDILRS